MSEQEPLDPKLRAMFDVERGRPGPSEEEAARVLDRLRASLGAAGGGTDPDASGEPDEGGGSAPGAPGSGTAPLEGASAAATSGLSVPIGALLFAAGVATGAGGHALLARTEPPQVGAPPSSVVAVPPSREASVSSLAVDAAGGAAPPSESSRPDAGEGSASARVHAPSAVAPRASARDVTGGRDRSLGEENALITRAQNALARGQIAGAIAALDEHARRFPDGQLREERNALRARARRMLEAEREP